MKSLRDISKEAKKGDLLLIEGAGEKHPIVLCEYEGLKLHHFKWNNIYENNWREKEGDFGWLWITGNPLEIKKDVLNHRVYDEGSFHVSFPKGLDGPGVERFELGTSSIISRLKELDLGLYAEVIHQKGLITSKNAKEAPRKLNLKRKQPLLFKEDVLEKILQPSKSIINQYYSILSQNSQ